MEFNAKAERWFKELPDELRVEARAVVGAIPQWMVDTLRSAGIEATPVHMLASVGETAFMLPPALIAYLERPSHG
ncbi:MAG: hypothetical protein JWN39_3147 [Ilumatobacteraceae bacterium]|nr:hypothetical protein [Ilumatobacteraceae bacterium]